MNTVKVEKAFEVICTEDVIYEDVRVFSASKTYKVFDSCIMCTDQAEIMAVRIDNLTNHFQKV